MDHIDLNELEAIMNEKIDFDNYDYYYHIIFKNNVIKFLYYGLGLIENRLSSTTIKIEKQDIENIETFIQNGIDGYYFRETIVLLSFLKDETNNMILPANPYFKKFGLNYYILKEYVVGYINSNE